MLGLGWPPFTRPLLLSPIYNIYIYEVDVELIEEHIYLIFTSTSAQEVRESVICGVTKKYGRKQNTQGRVKVSHP